MKVIISNMFNNDWDIIFDKLKDNHQILNSYLNLYNNKIVYPDYNDVFNAFKLTPLKNIKVVILGQDPYHTKGCAHGLSFSVKSTYIPPSLKNIFKELKDDLGITKTSSDLTSWAREGVFLLNTILTVEEGKPLSHKNIGWEDFTTDIIKIINNELNNIVFILWGNNAIKYSKYIDNDKHLILSSSHPSFFSANKGFFGSKVFSKTNDYLIKNNKKKVNWE